MDKINIDQKKSKKNKIYTIIIKAINNGIVVTATEVYADGLFEVTEMKYLRKNVKQN